MEGKVTTEVCAFLHHVRSKGDGLEMRCPHSYWGTHMRSRPGMMPLAN